MSGEGRLAENMARVNPSYCRIPALYTIRSRIVNNIGAESSIFLLSHCRCKVIFSVDFSLHPCIRPNGLGENLREFIPELRHGPRAAQVYYPLTDTLPGLLLLFVGSELALGGAVIRPAASNDLDGQEIHNATIAEIEELQLLFGGIIPVFVGIVPGFAQIVQRALDAIPKLIEKRECCLGIGYVRRGYGRGGASLIV